MLIGKSKLVRSRKDLNVISRVILLPAVERKLMRTKVNNLGI